MANTVEKSFATRLDADLAVERLVQEFGIERTDIFISSPGPDNSAGEVRSGGDAPTALEGGREDAALGGAITVSVDVNDTAQLEAIEKALKAT